MRVPGDGGPPPAPPPSSPIAAENQLAGTPDWQINQGAAEHEVEGYASVTSAAPGDAVTLFVNASEPRSVTWQLYRLGYYGGSGGRLVAVGDPFPVAPQAPCPVDATTGMVECAWQPSASVTIDDSWVTGQYLFKLVRDDGFESYVPLVVREGAGRRAPLVYQSSVTTWQAYNLWGGTSLYRNLLTSSTTTFTGRRATRVSFDRPYEYLRPNDEGQPETEFGAGHLFLAERWMLQWLEKQGYDVSYVTNLDVDGTPGLLDGRKMLLDVGHDEYWTTGERDAVDAARDQGVSIGFFSANDAYWRVRLEASSGGSPRRVVTCYKSAGADPQGNTPLATIRFRDSPHAAPEDALIGQMYDLWTNLDAFPLVVGDARHWIYRGTGLHDGDTLSHLVGYEWDHVQNDRASPSVEIAATSSVFSQVGVTGVSNVTVYYPTPSSLVFSAGTIVWAWGLGKPGYQDDRVGKITDNVIARAGLSSDVSTPVLPPPPPADVGAARTTLVAGSGKPGYADGVGAAAEFRSPAGVAVYQGVIFVSDHDNNRIRRIALDGTVSTVAGCGKQRFADGMGTSACFNHPTGIVAAMDGTLYVADTENHLIRAIDQSGQVTTFAGNGGGDTGDASTPLGAGIAYPRGLALGPDGALYVASDVAAVRRIDQNGVTTLGTSPYEVSGVAVGKDGTVYAVETGIGRVSRVEGGKFVPIVNPIGQFGDRSGAGDTAMLRPAEGIVVDGNLLVVTDSANYKVRTIALDGGHWVTTLIGDGLAGQTLAARAPMRVVNPRGIAVSNHGYIVADTGNNRILRVEHPAQFFPAN